MKKSFFEKYRKYAPAVVRYGVGIVFLLFGIDQIFNPENWLAWTPLWVGLAEGSFWTIVGLFNLIVGAMLLLGLFVRIVALLGALHLIGVIVSIGYDDIAIRDFGLLLATLSVLLHGRDRWCLGGKGE